ncbi:FMN-binding protein [Microbacterium mangrovi]|uniref:FMN-binding protein n=1 Tax=Microbacterium mangrovi TaxID=1348253 RepID=A0A0B2A096_9MICO|nr:FMN-binding protein [Microbacterium mangrovi]KHK96416.1 FMN-binding protein [Microbacterium mangrovi]
MKKIVIAVLATLSGLVLLFSYKTSLDQSIPVASTGGTGTGSSGSGTTGSSGSGTTGSTGRSASPTPTGSSATKGSSGSGLKDGTFTGQAVDTQYGPVQVAITVSGGRITHVSVPEYPQNDPRDQEINSQAIPMLVSETTQAQSANIDMISGATYTSQGYLQSLQSALDQAK